MYTIILIYICIYIYIEREREREREREHYVDNWYFGSAVRIICDWLVAIVITR